jgi:hypothetical protein
MTSIVGQHTETRVRGSDAQQTHDGGQSQLKNHADSARVRAITILLRIGGVLTGSAFLTMLLPFETMASIHRQLGLGNLPRTPIVDYLARSVAAFYGFHGVLLFLVSSDPVTYKPFVTYVAWMSITLGAMLLAIDLHAGMPSWWTVSEGPWVIAVGLILVALNR